MNTLKCNLPLFLLNLVLPHVASLFLGRNRRAHRETRLFLTDAKESRKCLLT